MIIKTHPPPHPQEQLTKGKYVTIQFDYKPTAQIITVANININ
jgi:hypothetical protein